MALLFIAFGYLSCYPLVATGKIYSRRYGPFFYICSWVEFRAISLAFAHMRIGDMVYTDPIIIHLSLYSRSSLRQDAIQLSSKPAAVSLFPASAAAGSSSESLLDPAGAQYSAQL